MGAKDRDCTQHLILASFHVLEPGSHCRQSSTQLVVVTSTLRQGILHWTSYDQPGSSDSDTCGGSYGESGTSQLCPP